MGTRSLTFFYSPTQPGMRSARICCLYRQYDGYPSGHGIELAEFINSKKLVNGFTNPQATDQANGMNCLAAQVVAHFKTCIGQFYLMPTNPGDCGQEYEYHVYDELVIVKTSGTRVPLFSGSWKEFLKFCQETP